MERSIGSMGSEYTRFRVDPEAVPLLAKLDWNSIARRVFIDPAGGLVALMTPSSKHERYAWGTGRLMDAMDRAGTPVVALGSTRWRRPEDPENTGAVRRRLAELDALIGRPVPREAGGPDP